MKYILFVACLTAAPSWATTLHASPCYAELTAQIESDLGPPMKIKGEADTESIHVWIDAPIEEAAPAERYVVAALEAQLTGQDKEKMKITWLDDDQGEVRRTPSLLKYALAHADRVREISVELPDSELQFVLDQFDLDRRPSEAIVQTDTFRMIAELGFGNLRDFKFEMEHELVDPSFRLVITLER